MATIFYPGKQPKGTQPNGKPWPKFRPNQIEAITTITKEISSARYSRAVLVGAAMGSGKTPIMAEVILRAKPRRVLIVGVRDAYDQWADTLHDQGAPQPLLQISSTAAGMQNLGKLTSGEDGFFYVGLEMLRAKDWDVVSETKTTEKSRKQRHTFKNMPPVHLLISDEAHRHSNQQTSSVKTVMEIKAISKVALSGTFFGNKFENAWVVATWLWGNSTTGNKAYFKKMYCSIEPVMSKDGRTQLRSPNGHPLSKVVGEIIPGQYVKSLPCYVFLPSPLGKVPEPEVVTVKLHAEQAKQYDEMVKQSLTWIPTEVTRVRAPLVADLPLIQRGRLRTAALGTMTLIPSKSEEESDKISFSPDSISSTLDAAYEVLHRPSWVGKKALILTHSLPFANEVARRIGQKYPVFLKTGNLTSAKWKQSKNEFMRPVSETGVQYLVAVISAVGTATDGLQANCSKVLWLSEDDNNTNNLQGSNRIWRQGVDVKDYESVKIVQLGTVAEGVLAKNNSHRVRTLDSIGTNK